MPWRDLWRNPFRAPQPNPPLNRPSPPVAIARPRGRPSWALGGFDLFRSPLSRVPIQQNYSLYHGLRETIPLLNAAITKTTEFMGTPEIDAEPATKQDIEQWLHALPVNRLQTGWTNWLSTWKGNQLEYGRSHTEIILTADGKDVYALSELHPATIQLHPSVDRYSLDVVQFQALGAQPLILPPKLMLNAVHNVQGDDPNGTSLFWGLPFVAECIQKMVTALGNTNDRFGVPTFHVNWETPDGFSDPTGDQANEILAGFEGRFNAAMESRKNADLVDFFTSGKVTVTVVGAAGETLEFEAPMRTLLEQVVAVTGIPAFLFSFHWSTTERMSAVQASVLSEKITKEREEVDGEITYLVRLRQQLTGGDPEFKLCWPAPTLLDALDTSRAALFLEQSRDQLLQNEEALWRLNVTNRFDFVRRVRPDMAKLDNAEILRRLPKLPEEAPALPSPAAAGAGGAAGGGAPPRNGTNPQMSLNMAEVLGLKNGGR